MKIAIFTDTFPPEVNGVSFCVQSLAEEASRKHEVIVIAPKSHPENSKEIEGDYKLVRFPSIPLKAYALSITLPNILKLYRVIKSFEPDIIHIHSPGPLGIAGVMLAKLRNIPLVGTYHSLFSESVVYISPLKKLEKLLPEHTNKKTLNGINNIRKLWKKTFALNKKRQKETKLQRLTWKAAINFYDNCDKIIVPSKTIKTIIDKKGLKDKTILIPNGIKLKSFFSKKKTYETRYEVLYVGRLVYEKNIDIVIKAFVQASKKIPKLSLKIVGDGPALPSLKKLVESYKVSDKTLFTGNIEREKLPQVYRNSDLLVTASTMEVQPLVLLEAMSSGLPVVGVKKYGINDLIKHGQNGFLAKPGNYKEMATYICKLVEDAKLREELGKNAIQTAKDHDIINVTKATLKLYKEVKSHQTQ